MNFMTKMAAQAAQEAAEKTGGLRDHVARGALALGLATTGADLASGYSHAMDREADNHHHMFDVNPRANAAFSMVRERLAKNHGALGGPKDVKMHTAYSHLPAEEYFRHFANSVKRR